jgi:predicted nucleic acid-binding protein
LIVVDTNVLAYAILPGRSTANALAALRKDDQWVAPRLWRSELRNVLALEMRLHGMSLADATSAFAEAEKLIAATPSPLDTAAVLALTKEAGATAYDCEFVALAEHLGLRLITGDRQLAARFPEVAVDLSEFAPADE